MFSNQAKKSTSSKKVKQPSLPVPAAMQDKKTSQKPTDIGEGKSLTVIENKVLERLPQSSYASYMPTRMVGAIADEVVKTMMKRIPNLMTRSSRKTAEKTTKKLEKAIFLDTSAIIDGRIFEVIKMGLTHEVIGILETVLLELKHIADSQDTVKRERGRKGLERLEELKKAKGVQVVMALASDSKKADSQREVDEKLIQVTKSYHGVVVTCDYNLEKKAAIQGLYFL